MREFEVKQGLQEAIDWEKRQGGEIDEASAAPSMFMSWVERLSGELEEAVPNMKMWATSSQEKTLASNSEKMLRSLKSFKKKRQ